MKKIKTSKVILAIWYLILLVLTFWVPSFAFLILITAGLEWLWGKPVIRIKKQSK